MLPLVSASLSFTAGMHPISFNRVAVNMMATPNAAAIYDGKYAAELRKTANAMVAKGKGLLACDESTGTVGKRLEANGMENTETNRCAWRNLLFTTAGLGEFISGAILYEETLFQNDPNGKPFVDVLNANGIIPGIKVDVGLKPLVGGGPGETWCTGLDTLAERAPKYYAQGARFAKWRTGLKIDVPNGCPTDLAIEVAAQDLARYARICQESGLVPIVEPEILIDGDHSEKGAQSNLKLLRRAAAAHTRFVFDDINMPPGRALAAEVAAGRVQVLEQYGPFRRNSVHSPCMRVPAGDPRGSSAAMCPKWGYAHGLRRRPIRYTIRKSTSRSRVSRCVGRARPPPGPQGEARASTFDFLHLLGKTLGL